MWNKLILIEKIFKSKNKMEKKSFKTNLKKKTVI